MSIASGPLPEQSTTTVNAGFFRASYRTANMDSDSLSRATDLPVSPTVRRLLFLALLVLLVVTIVLTLFVGLATA